MTSRRTGGTRLLIAAEAGRPAHERAVPADDIERRARFLATIVNGLFTERALPTNALGLEFETDTLHMPANAVTTGSIGAERSEL
ncbi:hypothetical protein ABZ356_18625 [Micromonospora zamorensis]|uniref:hypothetical protein n=1 Tax=Micromonospora zamorensis TaxID=709883 RepID=UPI0033B4758D